MTIQIRRTGSNEYGRFLKVLFCGFPGSGKTLISSTFPNPFYASAEGGLMSIADRNIPYAEVKSGDDLLRIKNALDQPPDVREHLLGFKVDTLVIDTIDEVQRILVRERLEETKKETLQLQDWGWLGEQMQAIIRGLRNLDLNVVMNCHMKTTEDSETGKMMFKPQMQGAISDQLPAFVDLSLLLRTQTAVKVVDGEAKKSTERVLQTFPDSQHPWIKDRSGKLPMEIPVDFATDYQRIVDFVFGGIDKLQNPEPTDMGEPEPQPTVVDIPDLEPTSGDMVLNNPGEPEVPKPNGPALPQQRAARKKKEVVPEPPLEMVAQAEIAMPEAPMDVPPPIQNPGTPELPACTECGSIVESGDQADLSRIRFRKILCRPCFTNAKRK